MEGTRFTLIYFTQQSYDALGKHTPGNKNNKAFLKDLHFNYPPPGLFNKEEFRAKYDERQMRLLKGEEAYDWWVQLKEEGKSKSYDYEQLKEKHTVTKADVIARFGERQTMMGLVTDIDELPPILEGKRKRTEVCYKEINPLAYTGYRFKNTDFDMAEAQKMEVEEEDGTWRVAMLYRRKKPQECTQDVVLWCLLP